MASCLFIFGLAFEIVGVKVFNTDDSIETSNNIGEGFEHPEQRTK